MKPEMPTKSEQFPNADLADALPSSSMRHPNILQIYDSGQANGLPYIAMEYCSKGTLGDKLKAVGKLPPREAAELFAALADGVGVAHAEGIIHRDLKPGNVLFDANGVAKVADFGLAKRASGSDLTQTQAVMGTPAYMSPEQAGSAAKYVGPPADVWALGVMLYEALRGRRPFAAEDMMALLDEVRSTTPTSLRCRRTRVAKVDRPTTTGMARPTGRGISSRSVRLGGAEVARAACPRATRPRRRRLATGVGAFHRRGVAQTETGPRGENPTGTFSEARTRPVKGLLESAGKLGK